MTVPVGRCRQPIQLADNGSIELTPAEKAPRGRVRRISRDDLADDLQRLVIGGDGFRRHRPPAYGIVPLVEQVLHRGNLRTMPFRLILRLGIRCPLLGDRAHPARRRRAGQLIDLLRAWKALIGLTLATIGCRIASIRLPDAPPRRGVACLTRRRCGRCCWSCWAGFRAAIVAWASAIAAAT